MSLLKRLSQIVAFLWISSIPTSIAYHFNKSAGLVGGILVDYRIPMISVSAALFGLFILLCLLQKKVPKKTIVLSLIFTLLFQSGIALYQFRAQRSLLGYIPLGEVDFSSPQIAKGVFFNGAIYKLPYGTTVHPNLLAGFMVLAFLLLMVQKNLPIKRKYLSLLFLTVSLICFLTQSLSATLAILLGGGIFLLLKKKHNLQSIIRIGLILIPIISFWFFSLSSVATNANTSLSRRSELQTIAVQMMKTHPLAGVGWNNFTLVQESYGYVPSTVRFLQPVHNIFLLLISELGILGWLICIALILVIWKIHSNFLPIVGAIIFISSLDHYLLTLTTGRMLIILCVLFYITKRRNQTGEV